MSNPLFGSDSDSSYASSSEEDEASPRAGGKNKGDKVCIYPVIRRRVQNDCISN